LVNGLLPVSITNPNNKVLTYYVVGSGNLIDNAASPNGGKSLDPNQSRNGNPSQIPNARPESRGRYVIVFANGQVGQFIKPQYGASHGDRFGRGRPRQWRAVCHGDDADGRRRVRFGGFQWPCARLCGFVATQRVDPQQRACRERGAAGGLDRRTDEQDSDDRGQLNQAAGHAVSINTLRACWAVAAVFRLRRH